MQIRLSQSDEKIWSKCSHAPFSRVYEPLTCWISKGVLKRCFLESGLNKSLTVCNFRNKVAITIILFFKMFKISSGTKNTKKVFRYKDNCIPIWDNKFSQYQTGYFSLAVNVLGNTPKISHITEGDVFQIRFSLSDEKIW